MLETFENEIEFVVYPPGENLFWALFLCIDFVLGASDAKFFVKKVM